MLIYTIYVLIIVAALLIRLTTARMKLRTPRRALVMTMLAIATVGIVFGFYQADELDRLRVMKSWPAVEGTIDSADIRGDRAIVPHVVYSYTLGDSTYHGTSDLGTPAFGNRGKRLNEAETLVAAHPVGSKVKVHWNPNEPSQSYILAPVPWNIYMLTGFWVFLSLSATLILILFGFKRRDLRLS